MTVEQRVERLEKFALRMVGMVAVGYDDDPRYDVSRMLNDLADAWGQEPREFEATLLGAIADDVS